MKFRALRQVDVVIVVSPLGVLTRCCLLYFMKNISLPISFKVSKEIIVVISTSTLGMR